MFGLALLLVAQQSALVPASAGLPGFEPLASSAEEIRAAFPDAWRLPRMDRAGRELPSQLFEQRVIGLVREPLAAADTGRPALMLGDLLARVAAAERLPTLDEARKELKAILADARARVPAALLPQVEALLDLHEFLSPKWDPDDDDERCGFLLGESWELPVDCWPRHGGKRIVDQCAVFIAADLACIKLAETDFTKYFLYPNNNYLAVLAVPNSYRVEPMDCEPVAGLPCAARATMSADLQSDLPFPFSSYVLRLRMMSEIGADERVTTWIYSDSPDFYWMAGYDRYEPVHDATGAFVGTLVIRQFGCDIDGVPDGSSHHHGGMRSMLGGVRRQAEALARERAALGFFPATGAVPVTPVVPGRRL